MSENSDAALSLAEGVLRAAIRQGDNAFPVDPTFIADVIAELRRFRSGASPTAIAAEREACAMIAEADTSFMMLQDFGMQSTVTQVRINIAAAIRARGTT